MPVSDAAGLSLLQRKLCPEGKCQNDNKSAREVREVSESSRLVINEPRLPINRPVNDIHNSKTTTVPTTSEKNAKPSRRRRSDNPADLLIELQVEENMMQNPDITEIPTNILEAELKRRHREGGTDTGEVTEAELDALSAQIFDRPQAEKETSEQVTETGEEVSEAELDKLSAGIFGREVSA